MSDTFELQNAAAGPDESILSDEEKKMVEEFSEKIDLSNSNAILQYGAGSQKKMAEFSDLALENVRAKDLGEVGDMLSQVVTKLQQFDATEEDEGFFSRLFHKTENKITALKAKYDKAENNVNAIAKKLEDHQVVLLKDIAKLDQMYDANLTYFKELTMYLIAGKKKLEKVRASELPAAVAKAQQTGLAEDAQAARDLESMCDRFEKKLHDLDLTRTVSMQTAPQIRLIQSSDTLMSEKIQSTLVNTIPLWKSQMVLALGMNHASQAAQAQQQVSELTNELLKKNSEALKTASVQIARESERGIVDLETLQKTNADLLSTFDEIMKIQADGRAKRQAAEVQLRQMEAQLKDKLLEIQN